MKFARFFCNFTPEIDKKYMAAINDLVRQIENPELRQRIQQEVAKMSKQKKFGLVFEEHLPENTPLYELPIRSGIRVSKRDGDIREKALAQYATENSVICRAQLIRMIGEKLVRLDFARHSELREKVGIINSNEELENLFTQYGE